MTKTLQAAGIVASWFGVLASTKPVRFSVSIGDIPPGNVVIFVNKRSGATIPLESPTGAASLSIKTNPSDPYSSALILTGEDDDHLLIVARRLSLMKGMHQTADESRVPLVMRDVSVTISWEEWRVAERGRS